MFFLECINRDGFCRLSFQAGQTIDKTRRGREQHDLFQWKGQFCFADVEAYDWDTVLDFCNHDRMV